MSRIKRRVPQRGKDGSKDRRSHEQKEPQGIMAAAFEKAMVMGGEKKNGLEYLKKQLRNI
jgi:hypothetical protein